MSNSDRPSPGAPSVPASEPLILSKENHPEQGQQAASNGHEVYAESDRLVMLTPCYGGNQTVLFRDSVHVALTQSPRANFRCDDGKVRSLPILAMAINHPGDSHIDRARNKIVHDFEQTHYKYALFCDGDQPFEPQDIALTWFRLMSGVRVLGGCVALKTLKTTFACNTIGNTKTPDPVTKLLPGRDTGTGWMAFNRDVLVEIRTRWPQLVRERLAASLHQFLEPFNIESNPNGPIIGSLVHVLAQLGYSADISYLANQNSGHGGETLYAYFASGVTHRDGAGDWLSEDWLFCHRCLQLGIPIQVDPLIRIKHLGPMLFPPDPHDLVGAALQVTSGTNPPFNPKLAATAHAALAALVNDFTDQSITILHPTRSRPQQALAKRALWYTRAKDPASFEYIFGVDEDDTATIEAFNAQDVVGSFVVTRGQPGAVAAINAAAAKATGRILVMAADDCTPPPNWDQSIREALKGQLHEPRLLWTSDGYSQQPVITHPIMTRALYEAQGWFFCPEYPHLFCDTELTVRAEQARQIIDARHIVLQHDHPMFTGAKPDALHLARNSKEAIALGRAIFTRRNPGVQHPHLS